MTDGRHPIEEVRRVARASVDSRDRFLIGRTTVTDGDPVTMAYQIGDQGQCAIELRRHRHDANLSSRPRDLRQDVIAGEVATAGSASRL